jgi:diguanylate cyclase (GGDEF)-like protein/PAS domain S-box-containing protein
LTQISKTVGPAAARSDRRQALRQATSICAMILLVVGASILGLWFASRKSIQDSYRHHFTTLAQAAAALVDPSLHDALRASPQAEDATYWQAVEPLQRLRRTVPEIRALHIFVREGAAVHAVLDTTQDRSSGHWRAPQAAVREDSPSHVEALATAFGGQGNPGKVAVTEAPEIDDAGRFITAYAPILDRSGRQIGVLGIDVDAGRLLGRLTAARERALVGLMPALLLTAILGVVFYRSRLRALTDAATAIERAQAALAAAEDLAKGRSQLHAVIEGTRVGTWEWDAVGGCSFTNDRWTVLVGTSGVPELERGRHWKTLMHAEDWRPMRRAIAAGMASAGMTFASEIRMWHADGRWVWLLAHGKVMRRDARGRPLHIAGIVMDVSARKAMESALVAAASRDKLTGLPNRVLFMEHLDNAVARVRAAGQAHFAVLCLDLDRFKLINDALGREGGDEVLRKISQRLREALRFNDSGPLEVEGDLVSRFGGDEFMILLNRLRSIEDAVTVAERILNILAPAYGIFGVEVHSRASIGLVTSDQCGGTPEQIVRNADAAMYEAKRSGRGCTVVFNEALHARLTRHVAIETSLRRAIGSPEIYLEYQPIVNLETGEMASVEALIRWQHPTLGPVSPNEFIPIAEESGLIVSIGQWVQREACRQMAEWLAEDPGNAPQMVSVNLSRAELALGDHLLDQVRGALQSAGLAAGRLQLEVTEREVMRNPDAARALLRELHDLGIRLAMDDFGTGTSSLSQLRGYDFDTIKIDRSFLQDLTSSDEVLAVIHATVNLIANLGMASLAEGVEEAAQVAVLQSLGCNHAQGYFFSRPVAAGAVLAAAARLGRGAARDPGGAPVSLRPAGG